MVLERGKPGCQAPTGSDSRYFDEAAAWHQQVLLLHHGVTLSSSFCMCLTPSIRTSELGLMTVCLWLVDLTCGVNSWRIIVDLVRNFVLLHQ